MQWINSKILIREYIKVSFTAMVDIPPVWSSKDAFQLIKYTFKPSLKPIKVVAPIIPKSMLVWRPFKLSFKPSYSLCSRDWFNFGLPECFMRNGDGYSRLNCGFINDCRGNKQFWTLKICSSHFLKKVWNLMPIGQLGVLDIGRDQLCISI